MILFGSDSEIDLPADELQELLDNNLLIHAEAFTNVDQVKKLIVTPENNKEE